LSGRPRKIIALANSEAVERLSKSFEADAAGQWDTFITTMIGGSESADFLRWLALQMRDTNWSDTGSRGLMIEKSKISLRLNDMSALPKIMNGLVERG